MLRRTMHSVVMMFMLAGCVSASESSSEGWIERESGDEVVDLDGDGEAHRTFDGGLIVPPGVFSL